MLFVWTSFPARAGTSLVFVCGIELHTDTSPRTATPPGFHTGFTGPQTPPKEHTPPVNPGIVFSLHVRRTIIFFVPGLFATVIFNKNLKRALMIFMHVIKM